MMAVDLSIIIVNWNSKDYLQKCIASILANTFDIEYEIIVVDSGSFDGCGDMLQLFYPQVRFIQSQRNVGFARANNLGAELSRGNALLFLNPDTEVQCDAIKYLYAHLRELSRPGIIGCRLLNSDGSLQTSCVQPFPTILNQILNAEILQRWFPKVDLWVTAATFRHALSAEPVQVISGACMMTKREVFDRVWGFSTDYFMYAEDLDLCYKTRAAGFVNYHVPGPEIVHHGGGSTKHEHSRFSNVMKHESVSRLLRKTRGHAYTLGYRLGLTAAAIARLALLALFLPIELIRSRKREWYGSFNKWVGILRWGLGLENWVKKYDQPKEFGAGLKGEKGNQCAQAAKD